MKTFIAHEQWAGANDRYSMGCEVVVHAEDEDKAQAVWAESCFGPNSLNSFGVYEGPEGDTATLDNVREVTPMEAVVLERYLPVYPKKEDHEKAT